MAEGANVRKSRVVAAIATVIALSCGIAVPAQAATGTVTITVKLANGSLATEGCMELSRLYVATQTFEDCTVAGGKFSIAGLPMGSYDVHITGVPGHVEYQGGAEVSSDAPTYARTVTLSKGGVVTGTVTGAGSVALAGATVALYRANEPITSASTPMAVTTTALDGTYSVTATADNWARAIVTGPAGYGATIGSFSYVSSGDTLHQDFALAQTGLLEGVIATPPSIASPTPCILVAPKDFEYFVVAKKCGAPGTAFSLPVAPGAYSLCIAANAATTHCVGASAGTGAPYQPSASPFVTTGNTTTVALDWGGTLSVAIHLDNGGTITDGCLSATIPNVGTLEDCTPDAGRFAFDLAEDVPYTNATFALHGSTVAADTQFISAVIVLGGEPFVTSGNAKATGTGALQVAVQRDDAAALTTGCVSLSFASDRWTEVARTCNIAGGVGSFTGLAPGDYAVSVVNAPGTFVKVWAPSVVGAAATVPVHVTNGATAAASVMLPTTQTISGRVTDANGARSDGVVQWVVNGAVAKTVVPSASGDYSFTVPVVQGFVRAVDFAGAADMYAYNAYTTVGAAALGGPEADSRTITGRNILLRPATTFEGTIAAPEQLAGGAVCLFAQSPYAGTVFGSPVCGDVGDPFALPVVPGFGYNICVQAASADGPCGANTGEYSDFVGYQDSFTRFEAPAGGGDVPVSIAFGGDIHVTVDSAGLPLTGACAILSDASGDLDEDCEANAGAFDFVLLSDTRNYDLSVRVEGVSGAFDSSPQVVYGVASGDTRQVALTVEPWPKFVGTITRPAGHPDTTACVFAMDLESVFEHVCLEPGDSTYELPVPPGKYVLEFYTEEHDAAWEYYNNAVTLDAAKRVAISSGTVTINAALAVESTIGGTVTGPGGAPIAGGFAIAYATDGGEAARATVDGAGHYTLHSLPAGTYRVKFTDFDGAASAWYGPASTFGGAKTIALGTGTGATVNMTLGPPATLSGTVTFDGAPASGGCVEVWGVDGYQVARTCELVGGAYLLDDLRPGKYVVEFAGFDGAADAYFGGSVTFDGAALVTMTAGTPSVADMALARGGTIAGKVYSDLGIAGYTVELYTQHGEFIDAAELSGADAWGEGSPYEFTGVPAGTYKIALVNLSGKVVAWRKAQDEIAREAISVPSGDAWTVSDVNLGTSGAGSGFITGTLNAPATFTSAVICVVAVNSANKAVASDCGARGDAFVVGALENTTYRYAVTNGSVRTAAQYASFTGAKRWYGNTTSATAAPMYYAFDGVTQYFPFWFYADVTYKTTNFDQIQWMGDQNIYRPSANTFRPESTLIRRDLAIYLYKAAGSPAVTLPSKSPFADVKTTDPAYRALLWMRATKIWTSSTFKPTAAVDKKTEALILYRAAGSPAVTLPSKNPYTDIKSSDSAYKAVTWANKYKIVAKTSTSKFGVTSTVKRKYGAASLFEWWWRYG